MDDERMTTTKNGVESSKNEIDILFLPNLYKIPNSIAIRISTYCCVGTLQQIKGG